MNYNSYYPKLPISAAIITHNEADRIVDCIRSLHFCDEVIVVDSHSTDDTPKIVQELDAHLIVRDWPGFAAQKQFAVNACRNDWVLCLDADERVSATLRDSIIQVAKSDFTARGYRFARSTRYFGTYLRRGNAYPDRVLRLFHRQHGHWETARQVHEHVVVRGTVATLNGDLLHDAYRDYDDQLRRLRDYARLMATHMHQQNRTGHLFNIITNPLWRFLRGYILRAGFLDGWRGFVYHATEAQYVYEKFLRLYLLQHRKN